MGKRKRKIKINADDPPPNPDTGSPSAGDALADLATRRNWADLPEPLLVSIVERLPSATDHVAFASACRSWRSAASSASRRAPPLLFVPAAPFLTFRNSPFRQVGPTGCRLHTLTLAKSYRSRIAPLTPRRPCIGCSHAQLIFLNGSRSAILADAFTGREVSSPDFPAGSFYFSFGILTAPLSSTSCLVLVVARDNSSLVYSVLCWRPGSVSWLELKLNDYPEILSLVVFKGQVFGLDSLYRTIVIDFEPHMSCRLLGAPLSADQSSYGCCGKFGQHLFECDGELQMVVFAPSSEHLLPRSLKIEVYGLDMSMSMWVKKESLGNRCVFIDVIGKCAFACSDPMAWGGRRNCVYVAGPGFDRWSVFSVDGEPIDTDEESPLNPRYLILPEWPSPVWVYPGLSGGPAKVATPAIPVIPPAVQLPAVDTEASSTEGSAGV